MIRWGAWVKDVCEGKRKGVVADFVNGMEIIIWMEDVKLEEWNV